MNFLSLHGLLKIPPQKPQMLRGYLIRLTREYTDGGMDSHAEEEKRCHLSQNGDYCFSVFSKTSIISTISN